MSVPPRPRTYMRKAQRREQILESALAAFLRGGYHGTHVEHIIQEAGIARGTFYLHFESKHEVFAALVDRMLAIFLQAPPADDGELRTLDDARRMLTRVYGVVLSTFRRHHRLCRLLFDEAVGIDKGFAEQIEKHYAEWHRRVRTRLESLVAAGVARPDMDLDLTADLVLGMIERITRRHVLRDEEPDLDRLVAVLVDIELRGVAR